MKLFLIAMLGVAVAMIVGLCGLPVIWLSAWIWRKIND